jgi:hypothetical protein
MAALSGAVESSAPVSRLHEHRSFEVADFPVPAGREEEWPHIGPVKTRRAGAAQVQ